jgi:hypothetical protein
MPTDWKHHTTGSRNSNGLTRAELEAQMEEEIRRERDAAAPKPDSTSVDQRFLGAPRVGQRSNPGGSSRSSDSRTYDYTGMDEAAKVKQALDSAEGSFISVAMEDPMKIPQLQNSIRSMRDYLTAYENGQGLPPVRIKSENASSGTSSTGGGVSYTRDPLGSKTDAFINDAEEEQAAVPAPAAEPPDFLPPPQQGPPLPGLGGTPTVSKWLMPNQGGSSDGSKKPTYGIPDSIDDPVTKSLLKRM